MMRLVEINVAYFFIEMCTTLMQINVQYCLREGMLVFIL